MIRINWDKHPILDKCLLEWEAEGYGFGDIAAELTAEFGEHFRRDFTEDQVRYRRKRIQRTILGDWPLTEIMPYFRKHELVIRGLEVKKMDLAPHLKKLQVGRRKALVLGDPHIPFQDDGMIQRAVDRYLGADIVIINGDGIDCYRLSKYQKRVSASGGWKPMRGPLV